MDVLLVKPDQMSVGELTTYISHLENNNQNTQIYAIAWWRKLVYPVAAWVMALVAFAFTPQTTRHGNMGLKLFGGICLGLLFHFAGRLFGFTSQLYGVLPFLAGALPTVLFALLAVYLIRCQEKR
ncbi:putative permease [Neisseria meningitidis]|nr:putative permease [Neisseria meningitidis]